MCFFELVSEFVTIVGFWLAAPANITWLLLDVAIAVDSKNSSFISRFFPPLIVSSFLQFPGIYTPLVSFPSPELWSSTLVFIICNPVKLIWVNMWLSALSFEYALSCHTVTQPPLCAGVLCKILHSCITEEAMERWGLSGMSYGARSKFSFLPHQWLTRKLGNYNITVALAECTAVTVTQRPSYTRVSKI